MRRLATKISHKFFNKFKAIVITSRKSRGKFFSSRSVKNIKSSLKGWLGCLWKSWNYDLFFWYGGLPIYMFMINFRTFGSSSFLELYFQRDWAACSSAEQTGIWYILLVPKSRLSTRYFRVPHTSKIPNFGNLMLLNHPHYFALILHPYNFIPRKQNPAHELRTTEKLFVQNGHFLYSDRQQTGGLLYWERVQQKWLQANCNFNFR